MCKDYEKITTRRRAADATVLLAAPKTQSSNQETQEIKLHCSKSCGAFQEKCNTPEKCRNYDLGGTGKCEIEKKMSTHNCRYTTVMST